jgi:Ca-activated chloride channel family protein
MFIAARSTPVPPIRLKISRRVEKEPSMEAPPVRILSALSRLTLYRMQERARLAADEGRFDAAATHLHNLATHLLSQGENSLAKTVLFEADNLESKRKWSAGESKKDIKYRTRALLMSSTKEKT